MCDLRYSFLSSSFLASFFVHRGTSIPFCTHKEARAREKRRSMEKDGQSVSKREKEEEKERKRERKGKEVGSGGGKERGFEEI